jgi:hypothetical protein
MGYPNDRTNPAGAIPVYIVAGPGGKAIPVNFLSGPSGPNFGPIPVNIVAGPGTPPFGNDQGNPNNAIPVYEAGDGIPVWAATGAPPSQISENTTPPSIAPTGIQNSGTVLTMNPGVWTNSPTSYIYQWTRNGANIGTNSNTYTAGVGDRGTEIGGHVIAVNAGGESASVVSSNTVQILGTPLNVVLPSVTPAGSVVEGTTLTLTNGTWTNNPTVYYYGWTRDGSAISGQSTNQYTTGPGDYGTYIGGVVQAANAAGGGVAVATSNTVNVTSAEGI